MPQYRAYIIGKDGRISSRVELLCPNDAIAKERDIQQRIPGPPFPPDEGEQGSDANGEGFQHARMQQAYVVDLNDPEHQAEQTASTSECADAIQPPAFGFCDISRGKQEHPEATQGGHRDLEDLAGQLR